jgi:hypothetical protein
MRLCLVQWEPLPLWGCLLGVMRKGFWSCFMLLKRADLLNQRGGGCLKIWNAPLTLMLEVVALAGVNAGLC